MYICMYTQSSGTATRTRTRTEDDGDLLVGFNRERVGHAALGPVERGAHPGDVRVPQQGAPLPRDGEVVHEALPRLDGALRHVRRPVRPPRPQLPNAVPVVRPHTYMDAVCIVHPENANKMKISIRIMQIS